MSAVDRTVPARGEAIADPYRHNLSFQTNYAASLPLNAAALNHVQCASNLIKDETLPGALSGTTSTITEPGDADASTRSAILTLVRRQACHYRLLGGQGPAEMPGAG